MIWVCIALLGLPASVKIVLSIQICFLIHHNTMINIPRGILTRVMIMMMKYSDDRSDFVDLSEVIADLITDIRYYSD